ncbi:C2H2-type zinc finger protein [Salinigranum rubrum]
MSSESPDGEFTCDLCGRTFESRRALKTHARTEHQMQM